MDQLQKLEATLAEVFEKKAPYQLPASTRKSLAGAMWWLALVFGLLQLWAAWGLWHLGHIADKWVDYANSISVAYGNGAAVVNHLGMFYYLSLGVVVIDAVLLLMAVPQLKVFKKRRGWNFLYYSLLINVAYGVVRIFSEVGGGVSQLLGAVIGSAIGAYFLFQVRSYFNGHKLADTKVGVEKTTTKTAK
jgi:hypothetical protein